MATLTYSIADDFPNGLDSALLGAQIAASAVEAVYQYINTDGDDCLIFFETEPSVDDVAIVDALIAAHITPVTERNFLVAEYNTRGDLTKETWYGTDNGGVSYSDAIEETAYTYGGPGNKTLLSKTITQLLPNGTPIGDPVTWEYATDGDKRIMKKVGV